VIVAVSIFLPIVVSRPQRLIGANDNFLH